MELGGRAGRMATERQAPEDDMRYAEPPLRPRNDGLRASQQRGSHHATVLDGEPGGGPHGAAKRRDGPDVAKVHEPGVGERCNGGTIDVRRRARAARGGAGESQRCGRAGRHVERARHSKTVTARMKVRRRGGGLPKSRKQRVARRRRGRRVGWVGAAKQSSGAGSGAGAAAAGWGADRARADKARSCARFAASFARRLSRDAFLRSMSPEGQGNVRGSPVAVALALSPRLGSPAQPTVRSPMLTRLRGSSDVVWPGRR